MYSTIKKKCWSSSFEAPQVSQHICSKPDHSCHRNICSFARIPSQRAWKCLVCAYTFLYKHFFHGWSFSNLDTFTREFTSRFERLRPPKSCSDTSSSSTSPNTNAGGFECALCGKVLSTPSVIVADAGQAFEALSSDSIRGTHGVLMCIYA